MALYFVFIISVLWISGINADDPPFPYIYGDHSNKYLGCYYEFELNKKHEFSASHMTIELCLDACSQRKASYAGLYGGRKCICYNSINVGLLLSQSVRYCYSDYYAAPCTGNPIEVCGARTMISLFCVLNSGCAVLEGQDLALCYDCSACEPRYGKCIGNCARGHYGPFCITTTSGCALNYHGADCEHWCGGCQGNKCNNVTGVCTDGCKPHFTGAICTDCVQGWNGTYCDHEIIPTCRDYHQYFKGQCVDCVDGYYGEACYYWCPANCADDRCDFSGRCLGCTDGFHGNWCDQKCPMNCHQCDQNSGICQVCNDGYYGERCDPCPANCADDRCDFNGRCLGCTDGFRGNRCDQKCPMICNQCDQNLGICQGCNDGYYGESCEIPCDKQCMTCNFVSGECESCKVHGYYGKDCDILCPAFCRVRLCDPKDGTCMTCLAGFYGSHCDSPCGNCDVCDKIDGFCLSDCHLGWFGDNCDQLCPSDCAGGACQKATGSCLHCTASHPGSKCESNEAKVGELLTALFAVIGVISILLVGLALVVVVMVVIPRIKASKQDSECCLAARHQTAADGASVEVYENVEGTELAEQSVPFSGHQQMASFSTPISHDSTTSDIAASQHKTRKQNKQSINPSTPATRPLPQKSRPTLYPKPTYQTSNPVTPTANTGDLSNNPAVANQSSCSNPPAKESIREHHC